jgi:hypothetical protein
MWFRKKTPTSTVRKIRVMADYQCWPLWEASPGRFGDIEPASLPISDSLRGDLLEWKRMFDSILNLDDPTFFWFF